MKYNLYLVSILLFYYCNSGFCNNKTEEGKQNQTTAQKADILNVQCSPELYDLASIWAKEYSVLNPYLNITVTKISDYYSLDGNLLSFITDRYSGSIKESSKWTMIIGHDAIVPVCNAKNPMLNEIYQKGVSTEKIARLFSDLKDQSWASILDGSQNLPLRCYIYDNETVTGAIAKFLKTDPTTINGIKVATSEEVISAVQKDVYAIGFCKLKDIRKINTNEWTENIMLLPIDKNGNGRMDNFENIYNNPDALARGVWIGKYPSALCGNICIQSAVKPTDKNALAFLTWISSDGGQFLNLYGYSDLALLEKQSNINALTNNDIVATQPNASDASYRWIIISAALAFIILILIVRLFANKSKFAADKIHITPVLNERTIVAPKGLYFDKTHTWAFMEQDGTVIIGIDDFLQHITGTITRIKMKEPGEMVRKGEKIFTIIRFGKQLDIYSPISGTIKVQNPLLETKSHLLNASPYSEGWVYIMEPTNWLRETQFMFMVERYKDWLKNEFIRLKDFFSFAAKANSLVYEQIILQDGGELSDNVLADMSPEVWEDFQTRFIDALK